MENDDLQSLVMRTLRRRDSAPEVLDRLERAGDKAFDLIVTLLHEGSLKDDEVINAISRLALLMRHQCHTRIGEVLEVCVVLLASDSLVVRSRATNAVIGLVSVLEQLGPELRPAKYRIGSVPSLREQIQSAVRTALERGIDIEQTGYACDFLANRA